jgi:NH3-dependent NAD+ synthetase
VCRSSRRRRRTAAGDRTPNILAFTLPGFATSTGTKESAHGRMEALDVTQAELDITPTALGSCCRRSGIRSPRATRSTT